MTDVGSWFLENHGGHRPPLQMKRFFERFPQCVGADCVRMKCKTCDGEMIPKSRIRLAVAGLLMLASFALVFVIPHFWVPGIILAITGVYLLMWATLGRGCWCRNCKKFSIF
jgi:hypothetical protein